MLPLCRKSCGVNNQLLIVPTPEVLLKFAAMYALGRPSKAGNTLLLPWNQLLAPKGWLWFISTQPGRFEISSNPSFKIGAQLGVGVAVPPGWEDTSTPGGIRNARRCPAAVTLVGLDTARPLS